MNYIKLHVRVNNVEKKEMMRSLPEIENWPLGSYYLIKNEKGTDGKILIALFDPKQS